MQLKRILGILLAFCFLMSVTAAAVSASEVRTSSVVQQTTVAESVQTVSEEHGEHHGFGDREEHRFGEHHRHHKHFHPDHWEKKRFGHREFRNSQWIMVYEYKSVFVKGYYSEF